jgi:hypothetical protein
MAFKLPDRTAESSTSTGTGNFTLAGALTGGFRKLNADLADGDTTLYCIRHKTTAEWEVGLGTYESTGDVLIRTTVLKSSNSNAAVSFSAGDKEVFVTIPSDKLVNMDHENTIHLDKTPSNAIPGVPATDQLALFARSRAGRMLLHMMGPAGIDVACQPALFGNNIVFWMPTTGTNVATGLGTLWTARNSGTSAAKSHPALATTNDLTTLKTALFGTGTTATGTSGEQSDLQFFRGNAAGRGGWFFATRFGLSAVSGTYRIFLGLSATNAAWSAAPSATASSIGIAKDEGDTNLQFLIRGAAATKVDTGVAPTVGAVYDFLMFAPPNGGQISFRLANGVTGALLAESLTPSMANAPATTVFMAVWAMIMSATGTTAKELRVNRMYCESDM